jgi:hypothetical protein
MTTKICLLHHQNRLKNISGVCKLPTEAFVLPVRSPYRSLPFRSSRSSAPSPLIINRRHFFKDLEHTHPNRRKWLPLSMQEWWTPKVKIRQLIRPSRHTKPCTPTKSATSFRMTYCCRKESILQRIIKRTHIIIIKMMGKKKKR